MPSWRKWSRGDKKRLAGQQGNVGDGLLGLGLSRLSVFFGDVLVLIWFHATSKCYIFQCCLVA